jgi:hypothetical protein
MSSDADQLYRLLPAVHRVRDAEQGEPLRQLIAIIADQVAVLEETFQQLYDNHFVETAAPWALPYLADLLDIRGLSGSRNLTRAPRAEVGHTIAYRRRKGTAAMLEMLARDVTGWPARAVEFFGRLAATQNWNHRRPQNLAFTSLRDANQMELFNSPFEDATRTVEVRRIQPGRGKWNIPNVGIFLWRLRAYSLTRSPLTPAGALAKRRFRLHPLGMDVQLFSRPVTEDEWSHLAEPLNVPMPITCRMFCGNSFSTGPAGAKDYFPWPNQFHPSEDYYGAGKSLVLEKHRTSGPLTNLKHEFTEIQPDGIVLCDLGDVVDPGTGQVIAWGHEQFAVAHSKILLDPTRGRAVFPADAEPDTNWVATSHYGFSANLGGGEYDRSRSFSAKAGKMVQVSNSDGTALATLAEGLQKLAADSGVAEITNSGRYEESQLSVGATDRQIEIRAADQHRPTLLLTTPLMITGDADGTVTLNGLLIGGQGIQVNGTLGHLRLRHCTLLPGLQIKPDGTASLDGTPAILVNSATTVVEIEDCIIGPLRVDTYVQVHLSNTIVDAGDETNVALANLKGNGVAGTWRIENCTVRGKVTARGIELASNSIFLASLAAGDDPKAWPAPMFVQRRQEGCMRFCWLPPGARVPRRYHCLPAEGGPDVRPQFTSLRFGDASYAQLGRFCDESIRSGADDESEVGAFHDLFQLQRVAYLRGRLAEYLRFGLDAGVFYAT